MSALGEFVFLFVIERQVFAGRQGENGRACENKFQRPPLSLVITHAKQRDVEAQERRLIERVNFRFQELF